MIKPFTINFSNGKSAQAVHLNDEIEIPDAINKLGLRQGQPTIVLVGGAGGLNDEDFKKLEFLFLNILAPLAENLKANVIDGGTDAGVMRLMGQARSKINAKFPLIGIAAERTITLPGVESSNPEAAPLESNHTHFVFVPGVNWGDESPWLSRIATELAKTVSSITVLINGGEITRKDIMHSLSEERPVVVVAGSGRLADEFGADYKKDSLLIKVINLTDSSETILELLENLLGRTQMDKFKEYKFFAQSTQYLSDRRQSATQTYLTVNTAIFAVLSFLFKDTRFKGVDLALVSLPLFLVGIFACSIWQKIISQYKSLIGWRYKQLMEMEKSLKNCHQMYVKEWRDWFEPKHSKEKFGFSRLEIWLPRLFLSLYLLYGIGLIIFAELQIVKKIVSMIHGIL